MNVRLDNAGKELSLEPATVMEHLAGSPPIDYIILGSNLVLTVLAPSFLAHQVISSSPYLLDKIELKTFILSLEEKCRSLVCLFKFLFKFNVVNVYSIISFRGKI